MKEEVTNSKLVQIQYRPPGQSATYLLESNGENCEVTNLENQKKRTWNFLIKDNRALVKSCVGDKNLWAQICLMDFLFFNYKEVQSLRLESAFGIEDLLSLKGIQSDLQDLELTRQAYYQLPLMWHKRKTYSFAPENWQTDSQGVFHPLRPNVTKENTETVYRRYIPEIKTNLSFRGVDIEKDLDIFHDWHNQPRVFDLWDLNQSKEELKAYLNKVVKDPHTLPLIMEFDEKRVGYFEVYWALEDRIAPYYESEAFDRGFHFLIGDEKFLGLKNTGAALRSISHFIFLEDIRTRRIVAEPRSDNKGVLKYVPMIPGWKFIKEFDFPHKRSALLMCEREKFFLGEAL